MFELTKDILSQLEKKIFTVSDLTQNIKEILEDEFFDIWVSGEISNFTTPISGHSYFTLKDDKSQIRCVLFKYQKNLLEYKGKNGDEVLLRGRLTVYEKRGEYQIIVDYMEPFGIGALFYKVEKLKEKLLKEGLFDEKHKKEIPPFPSKIGIITSITGAAVRDILNILKRRFLGVEIFIYPVKVQGDEAKNYIVNAIKFFNEKMREIDVLILARGGGSLEDLMVFNDEEIAREIFKSEIPIISAVGHETDFTIADLVADLRAPTPSAAAELVIKNKEDIIIHIENLNQRLIHSTKSILNRHHNKFHRLERFLNEYYYKIKQLKFEIREYEGKIKTSFINKIAQEKSEVKYLTEKLKHYNPIYIVRLKKEKVSSFHNDIINYFLSIYRNKKFIFENKIKLLNSLSPLNVLERGYSIVFKNNKIIKDSSNLKAGDKITIKFHKGQSEATVNNIKK